MIERYSRPRMKAVWSDENKYGKWMQVELAVCEAWTEAGVIPPEDMEALRRARYNHSPHGGDIRKDASRRDRLPTVGD